jgi:[protein-PII] uridylyltransferase
MTPASDVDLLFIDPGGTNVQRAAEAVLYPLWDGGFVVGHAVRTIEECGRQAAEDLATRCSQLDSRTLVGEEQVGSQVRRASWESAGGLEEFAKLLRLDRLERAEDHGSLGRHLRADIRASAGGLRDLQAIRWLEQAGRRPPGTVASLTGALDLFLMVRTALARASGSRSSVLEPEHHEAIAALLGIEDEPGWEARDVLVRRIADRARWVDVQWDLGPTSWATVRAVVGAIDPGQAATLDPDRPDARLVAAWATGLGEVACTDELRALLLTSMGSSVSLRALDGLGILARLITGWEDVRGRPQRDPYHRSHVDAHLVDAADGARDPVLALGALLHDIGKVGRGSHASLGEAIAARSLDWMAIPAPARDDVLFLVREHLLLSETAVRRDIDDEDLVLRVAAAVGDERRLELLHELTLADARATGPTASSPWRLGLIEELARRLREAFRAGRMSADRAARLRDAEAAIREAAPEGSDPDRFLAIMPPEYLLRVDPSDAVEDMWLIRPPRRALATGEVQTSVHQGSLPGTWRLVVVTADHPGLLATIAGALAVAGLSVVTADVFTAADGVALDVFEVRALFEDDEAGIPDGRWSRFREALASASGGSLDLWRAVEELRAHYPDRGASVPASVSVDETTSRASTILEVGGPDRPGVLFRLCRILAEAGLAVHSARVATYGPRIVDVFYVRETDGSLPSPSRVEEVRAALLEAVGSA